MKVKEKKVMMKNLTNLWKQLLNRKVLHKLLSRRQMWMKPYLVHQTQDFDREVLEKEFINLAAHYQKILDNFAPT